MIALYMAAATSTKSYFVVQEGLRPGWQESYGRGSLSRALPEVVRIKLNPFIPGQMIGLYIKNNAIWRKAKN